MLRPVFRKFLRSGGTSAHFPGVQTAVTAVVALSFSVFVPVNLNQAFWPPLEASRALAQTSEEVQTGEKGEAGENDLPNLEYLTQTEVESAEDTSKTRPSVPLSRNSPLVVEPIAPLSEPGTGSGEGAAEDGQLSKPQSDEATQSQTLGTAMQDMIRRNPVVAVVEGEEIRWNDVIDSAADLPEEYQSRIESVFPALLDRLIDLKLLANAGRQSGLDDDEALQRKVKTYEDTLIRDAYVAESIAAKIPEAELRTRYFQVLRANAAKTERHLRHVVVDSRDEALAVVQSLDDGLDFAELARNYSTGGSAANGGDLGFMRRESLNGDFAGEAFDLRVGTYSSRPIRTEFGWHVIKVEAERKAVLPTYEDLAPELRNELARQRIGAVLKKLRAEADLELFPEE